MRILVILIASLLYQAFATGHSQEALSSGDDSGHSGRQLDFFYNQRYRARDLWEAIQNQDADLFFEILECECVNLEETDESDQTALLFAVRVPNSAMSIALIEAGANVNAQDNIGIAPLHVTCFHHLTNVTTLLLEAGADVNARTITNERPIIMAQTLNDVPLLQALITAGAEINFQDAEGESPLHEASAYGAARNAEFLIERGADLTVREQQGRTPAEFICACRDFDERLAAPCFDDTCSEDDIRDLERVFRRAERRESAANDEIITVEDLWLAIVNGTFEEIEHILVNGSVELQAVTQSDTDAWDEGETALHLAIIEQRVRVCILLINAGASPGASNALGNTPLHLATRSNSVDIVQLILDQRVNVDEQNDEGQTALHIASFFGFIEVADLLVQNGATIGIHDQQGATAVEILCSCLLDETCPEGSCRNSTDIEDLMTVLNEEDEMRQQEVVELYYPNAVVLESAEVDALPDDDDGASSLGTFIGVLFALAFVFFVIYGIIIIQMRRRNAQRLLADQLNQPGPSMAGPSAF